MPVKATINILLLYLIETRYYEVPRDWQNLFAIARFCYIEVRSIHYAITLGQQNRSLYRGLRYLKGSDFITMYGKSSKIISPAIEVLS